MRRIKVLPESVKKKIAAGEVIEGPFSVVKELIENSIDSGATEIAVMVSDSGLKRIFVQDNGSGMFRGDIGLAIAEHATSKIDDFYDIDKIISYGFRGEALSSISSVSDISILSRHREEDIGARLVSSSGGVTINDYAGVPGTTVIVENLFYNVPARKKFLKTKRTELRYIRDTILKTAIALPGIAFSLDVDGKRQVTLAGTGSLEKRLKQVFGSDIIDNVYYDEIRDLKVRLFGFFSRPDFLKHSRSMQHIYVNSRPVDYRYFGFILSKAYEGIATKGKHPAAIVFIEIDPELVDINIHPAKREVKLFDQRYVDSLISGLAIKVLNRSHNMNKRVFKATGFKEDKYREAKYQDHLNRDNMNSRASEAKQSTLLLDDSNIGSREYDFAQSTIREASEPYDLNKDESDDSPDDFKILGTAFGTYIIAEKKDSLEFIDFHAVHERILFDYLMKQGVDFESQALAFPVIIELPIDEYSLILENIDEFRRMGFEIDDFSDNTITIGSAPEISGSIDLKEMLSHFIEAYRGTESGSKEIKAIIAASVACHSAKRSGDKLSYDEMRYIVRESSGGSYDSRCPHGRPYTYKIDKNELERIFKRL